MPIEFRCSQCSQLLRVPDDSAGKSARCPKCQALMTVPGGTPGMAGEPAQSYDSAGLPPPLAGAGGALPSASFAAGAAGGAAAPPPKPPGNPFGDGSNPFGEPATVSTNPYASPLGTVLPPTMMGVGDVPISPRPVAADAIFNYAWEVWKANIGLLVGVTITVGVINYAVALPFSGMQAVFQQNNNNEAAIAAAIFGQIINSLAQLYLGIGQMQIVLKLARWQPARFSDLFGGLPQLLPVLGGWLLFTIAFLFALVLLVVPAILLGLAVWPFYYLLIDRKAGVIDSFSLAATITKGNWGATFMLWLMSLGIILLGCAALCVGLLFAAPLVSVMWGVAYLMMSGQIPTHPSQARYAAAN